MSLNTYPSHPVITFIGKLNIHKGIVTLAKVMQQVLRKNKAVKFRLIGLDQPSHRPNVSSKTFLQEVLKPHLERVEFTGALPVMDMPRYLEDTTACIFPSLWENFPTVCLEAMSAARPVVASNSGGFTEIIHHSVSGYTYSPHNAKAMARQLLRLLDDPELCKVIGQQGRKHILKNLNKDVIGEKTELVYKDAVKCRQQSQ
jgi:glycosyltransferase involved in cell wall biosynthesis